MRIRQLIDISGTIDGAEWPGRGEELDLPDHVATDLIANGYAEAVAARKTTRAETAAIDPVDETAAAPKPRARRKD
jgi:hypothetical protein